MNLICLPKNNLHMNGVLIMSKVNICKTNLQVCKLFLTYCYDLLLVHEYMYVCDKDLVPSVFRTQLFIAPIYMNGNHV